MKMSMKPEQTITGLIEAINKGDLQAAMRLYEPNAVFVAEPGKVARGTDEIRKVVEGFISLKPSLRGESQPLVLEAGDTALFCNRWSLVGTTSDGKSLEMGGTSSDVLKRQADGRWLIAIDNPWGTSILRQ
jgi:uncharacterized protein (TIGR02246 family)